MWEQIQANRRKSILVVFCMAAVLVMLGYGIGFVIDPEWGMVGVVVAMLVWGVLWATAATGGSEIMLASAGAREISHEDNRRLDNIVEEMAIASGLPAKPKVYIMDMDVPNAFAVGTPKKSAIAVTTGLLMRLNRDELQGVVAHELGHISNQDTRFMVLAGVMLGAIVMLSDVLLLTAFYSGRGRRRSSAKGGGQAMIVFMLVALVLAILAPLLAQLMYFACSRKREYLADACAAEFTRYPEGLASALEKISAGAGKMQKVNRVTAPMYIVNPLQRKRAAVGLFSTHPPTSERVNILRSMAGGAGYVNYERAFSRETGQKLIGADTLSKGKTLEARAPSAAPEKSPLERTRGAVDILHRLSGFLFLSCACGLQIKVPPTYKEKTLHCPRCSRRHTVPQTAPAAVKERAAKADAREAEPLVFRRRGKKWQSFRCSCGKTIQLSPAFAASFVKCRHCGRTISIEAA